MKKVQVPTVEQQGIFVCGGPGTYIFLGPTDSGKNVCFRHTLIQAYNNGLVFSGVISYSTTSGFSDSLDVIEEVSDTDRWAKAKTPDELLAVFNHRVEHFNAMGLMVDPELGRPRTKSEIKQWGQDHPLLFILDDFGGKVNMSRNTDNPWYTLITTARHLGIYFVMIIQYNKAIGPSFWNNPRAVISFDRNVKVMKMIAEGGGFGKYCNKVSSQLVKWSSKQYAFTLWWISWKLPSERPMLPWMVHPVNENNDLQVEPYSPLTPAKLTSKRTTRYTDDMYYE